MKKEKLYRGKDYETTAGKSPGTRLGTVIEVFFGYRFDRILDVGCGDGNFALRLQEASKAREVYGIEIAEDGVALANKVGVKAVCQDIDKGDFPFEEGFFDAVFCGETIEHLYNPDHLLQEIHRTLKPGGLLVLSAPNLASWFNRAAILLGFQPYGTNPSLKYPVGHLKDFSSSGLMVTSDHIRMFTLRSLKALLKLYGFRIFRIIGIHEGVPREIPLSPLFNIVDKIFSAFPSLSYRAIICCAKEGGGLKAAVNTSGNQT